LRKLSILSLFEGIYEVPREGKLTLTPLLAGRTLGMWAKNEGNDAVHDDANPEVDEQTEVRQQSITEVRQQSITAVLSSERQVGHQQKIDRVP